MADSLCIVIPMAGRGSRFVNQGFELPKPLIPVGDKSMIELVIENVKPSRPHRFILIAQREHADDYELADRLQELGIAFDLVLLDGVTDGAACTILEAQAFIEPDEPLMTVNSDQWIKTSIDDYLAFGDRHPEDGLIMCMTATDPKWSFVDTFDNNTVSRVVEKEAISSEATVGIYNFASGGQFMDAASTMVRRGRRVNGEFYVAPVYNEIIESGGTVRFLNVGGVEEAMYGLGTPEDLELFLEIRPDAM